jgi:nitroreductase
MTDENAAAPAATGLTPFQMLLARRRSIRRFLPAPVEPDKVRACLEAARIAPSAHNAQPWRFIVIDDPALKEAVAAHAFTGLYHTSRFAAKAPVLLVLLARRTFVAHQLGSRFQRVHYYLVDMGIAGEHIVLQAEELGLSTCWMGWFSRRGLRRALKVPRRFKIVALMPLGYAEKRPTREPPRKSYDEIVAHNVVPTH